MDQSGHAQATAAFYRPLEALEIVRNGRVIATARGPKVRLTIAADVDRSESCWVAARARAETRIGEPDIRAHTNPTHLLKDGQPVRVEEDRRAVAAKWEEELAFYRQAGIVFPDDAKRREFFEAAERALAGLRR